MVQNEAVLFANEAFYQAFAERDMEAMENCWADGLEVSCIHPGWGPLHGRDAVLQSWLAILSNPEAPKIVCRAATATVLGDAAIVICFEEISGQFLLASNVYIHQNGRWRLVHHQAGPTADQPPEDQDTSTPRMN